MKRFIEGEDRSQSTLFPEHLDDYIAEDNPVRIIDVFVDEVDLNTFVSALHGHAFSPVHAPTNSSDYPLSSWAMRQIRPFCESAT